MPDGNGTGFVEKDTLELRAERLEIRCAGTARRSGESDRIEIGETTALDMVAGAESLHVKGRYTERIGRSASTRAAHLKTTVNGRLKVSGRAETTFLGGAMADSQAGAVLVAAGMSDDLAVGGGARATAPVDIWLAGLIGMEEKVGTAAADGVLMECYRTLFEREYGSGTHVAGTAVFSGTQHVTVKTGFRPMMKVLRGIRNLTPGGGGGSAPPPATPPATPPGEPATGLLGTFRGASDAENAGDLPRLSDSLAHPEDLANATETAGARDADTASRLEDLQGLRHATEQDDTEAAAAIVGRLHGDDAGVSQRPASVDFNARYDLSVDTDGSDMLVDPNASDSDPVHWRYGVGSGEHADDPGYSAIAGDVPQRLDDPADPGHAPLFGNGESAAAPPPATPLSDQGVGRPLPANVDTTGAIQRLEQEIALQTDEIGRWRDGGGSADELRRLEAEREARLLALSELEAGRDPRAALLAQGAGAGEAYRTEAFTDLVDYFGGAGQFSPNGTSPGAFGGRIPFGLDTSALIEDWRTRVGALSEVTDTLNPRAAAEIEHAEALADTEAWMRQAVVMMANHQDPGGELLSHAANLEALTFADGTTGAGEASVLRTMAMEYGDLLEEFLGSYPVFPQHLDEAGTPHGGSPLRLDIDAELDRFGQDVPVENTDIPSAGDLGADAVEPPSLDADRNTAFETARKNLGDDIHDAFAASDPGHDTPVADPGQLPTREDYWGMPQGLSPPAPGSSDNAADTATDPVRVPMPGERGESTWDSHHSPYGMEAAFDDPRIPPPSSSPPDSERYRIATEHLDEALELCLDTGNVAADSTQFIDVEDFVDLYGVSERPEGAPGVSTATKTGGHVR